MIRGDLVIGLEANNVIAYLSLGPSTTIPNHIRIISSYAFQSRSGLESLTWDPNPVIVEFESHAFIDCSALRGILIPRTVTKIGEECFANCSSLSTVSFEEDSVLCVICKRAFAGSSLFSIRFPRRLERLECAAFADCCELKNVDWELPSALTVIEDNVFHGCDSLVDLVVPSSVQRVAISAISSLSGSLVFTSECPCLE
jgi:hypothetical protein